MKSLAIAGVGSLALSLAAGLVSAPARGQSDASAERVAVLVFTRDLPAGTILRDGDVASIEVERRWVRDSSVQPEGLSYITGEPTTVPVLAGDRVLWTMFERSKLEGPVRERCARVLDEPDSAREQVARAKARVVSPNR